MHAQRDTEKFSAKSPSTFLDLQKKKFYWCTHLKPLFFFRKVHPNSKGRKIGICRRSFILLRYKFFYLCYLPDVVPTLLCVVDFLDAEIIKSSSSMAACLKTKQKNSSKITAKVSGYRIFQSLFLDSFRTTHFFVCPKFIFLS